MTGRLLALNASRPMTTMMTTPMIPITTGLRSDSGFTTEPFSSRPLNALDALTTSVRMKRGSLFAPRGRDADAGRRRRAVGALGPAEHRVAHVEVEPGAVGGQPG